MYLYGSAMDLPRHRSDQCCSLADTSFCYRKKNHQQFNILWKCCSCVVSFVDNWLMVIYNSHENLWRNKIIGFSWLIIPMEVGLIYVSALILLRQWNWLGQWSIFISRIFFFSDMIVFSLENLFLKILFKIHWMTFKYLEYNVYSTIYACICIGLFFNNTDINNWWEYPLKWNFIINLIYGALFYIKKSSKLHPIVK